MKKKNLEFINRATLAGYLEYMIRNPHYFTLNSGKEATPSNIEAEFKKLQDAGLVAAANVSPHCECRFCKNINNNLIGWKEISNHLRVSEKTAIRYYKTKGFPVKINKAGHPFIKKAIAEEWYLKE
jgi:hypothetical protein